MAQTLAGTSISTRFSTTNPIVSSIALFGTPSYEHHANCKVTLKFNRTHCDLKLFFQSIVSRSQVTPLEYHRGFVFVVRLSSLYAILENLPYCAFNLA